MAFIKCPECGKRFSETEHTCPYCGCPGESQQPPQQITQSDFQHQQDYQQQTSHTLVKCVDCGQEYDGILKACPNCGCPTEYQTKQTAQAYCMVENNLSRYPVSPIFKENFKATDTNGPMGECLFPTNSEGKIFYYGVIEAPCSKAELKEYAIRFFRELDKNPNINVKTIQTEYESRYDFDVILSSGKVKQEIHYAKYYRDRSRIRCHVALEFKEGRYRYTVNPYETNRLNLRGAAKCDGTPNEIHWQRVNSLNKRRDSHLIDNENETYKAEYEAVINLVKLLANYYNEMNQEADF